MAEARGEGESGGRKAVSQRSGAPGDVRSPADGHKQAGFTPAVKRNARRASRAVRTACLAQTGSCGTHAPGKMSSGARPTGISRRDSLPPLNAMPVVQVMQAVQCVLRRRAVAVLMLPARCRQEPGRRQARSRNSLPALSAAAVVQVEQSAQRVLRKRGCVFVEGLKGRK